MVIGAAAPQPQDEGDVRGAFLTTRPKDKPATSDNTAKPNRRRPKTANPNTSGNTNNPNNSAKAPEKKPATPTSTKTPTTTTSATTKPVNVKRIGLGLTLFTRDSNGMAVRIDPEHVFQKGDRVRLLLETNTDGYLYIFNTTNDGPVNMIYPNPDLDEAGNYIQAHVPVEIPASASAEERLRWLIFDEFPGNERLFFVFTREPLKGVPIEDELITFCRNSRASCFWHPSPDLWEQVQKQMQASLKTDKAQRYGATQTAPEQQATTRGISLAKDDPEPSLVMMASSTSPMLVATLDLIHK